MQFNVLIVSLLAVACFAVLMYYAVRAMSRKGGIAQVLTAVVACVFILPFAFALLLPLGRMEAPKQTARVSITKESSSNGDSMRTIEQIHSYQTVGEPAKVSPHEPPPVGDVQGALADVDPSLRTILAGGALACLLVLAYLFLDAGRRGRYTWPIRLGTAIVFTGLCVLLWRIGPLM